MCAIMWAVMLAGMLAMTYDDPVAMLAFFAYFAILFAVVGALFGKHL